ncbi:MAG: thioredoxin [Lachnospiraceae bacterium]|nr:thioredoxin [Lachnospiraceae bacterium]
MSVVVVNNDTFQKEVLESDIPVLVDFWATWCGPCKMLSPLVHQIAEEKTDIKVCSIDVDEAPELAQAYQVSSIPTLVVFKNGTPVNRSIGFIQKPQILALLQ